MEVFSSRASVIKEWQAHAFAVLATAVTFGLRFVLDGPLDGQPALVIFTLPITLSAYVGGLRGGLLATALTFFGASYYLLPPYYSFAIASGAQRWQQFFVTFAGILISALSEALHRARRRAVTANREHQEAEVKGKQGEEALRVSEKKLSSVLENMSEGVMLVDANGNLYYQNPASLRIHGFEPGAMGIINDKDLGLGWKVWDEQGHVRPDQT